MNEKYVTKKNITAAICISSAINGEIKKNINTPNTSTAITAVLIFFNVCLLLSHAINCSKNTSITLTSPLSIKFTVIKLYFLFIRFHYTLYLAIFHILITLLT